MRTSHPELPIEPSVGSVVDTEASVGELCAQVLSAGKITESDRHGLKSVILTEDMDEEERRAVDRLIRAMRRGRVQVEEVENGEASEA